MDRQDLGRPDRKSTRLNSSHSQISYAVFFFNDAAPPEIYPLPLHDPLPICESPEPMAPPAVCAARIHATWIARTSAVRRWSMPKSRFELVFEPLTKAPRPSMGGT